MASAPPGSTHAGALEAGAHHDLAASLDRAGRGAQTLGAELRVAHPVTVVGDGEVDQRPAQRPPGVGCAIVLSAPLQSADLGHARGPGLEGEADLRSSNQAPRRVIEPVPSGVEHARDRAGRCRSRTHEAHQFCAARPWGEMEIQRQPPRHVGAVEVVRRSLPDRDRSPSGAQSEGLQGGTDVRFRTRRVARPAGLEPTTFRSASRLKPSPGVPSGPSGCPPELAGCPRRPSWYLPVPPHPPASVTDP